MCLGNTCPQPCKPLTDCPKCLTEVLPVPFPRLFLSNPKVSCVPSDGLMKPIKVITGCTSTFEVNPVQDGNESLTAKRPELCQFYRYSNKTFMWGESFTTAYALSVTFQNIT